MRRVAVVATGVANTASVLTALARVGAEPALCEGAGAAAAVRSADFVVLPGVGAFAAGAAQLAAAGLVDVLRERVAAERPLLAICLGLQLLCEHSEESPGVAGLGVLPVDVTRFPDVAPGGARLRVPQLGWNLVEPDAGCRLLRPGYAYFANSYRVAAKVPGLAVATADHGGPFVAACERGAQLYCQFHPELSGPYGLDLLRRWLDVSTEVTPC